MYNKAASGSLIVSMDHRFNDKSVSVSTWSASLINQPKHFILLLASCRSKVEDVERDCDVM